MSKDYESIAQERDEVKEDAGVIRIVTSHALPVSMWDRIATAVVKRVAELPDRSSPDDWPEAMMVTGDELHRIIMSEFDAEVG